ncbi:tRNA (adenine(37)-N6)-methyltransferase [Bicyclus anynana]|uniref:tRNA (Adenine(37)-N6)-methyltransferase n=1 Tax=Bicyclus anynana TaxID=110368 RepID=A0A6J1N3I1_BICAN|nr:tRNA (adenine(37)-N6)-methyltransferase [Bicyclus anynana]XP_052744715.1 tRNA (adenine(37)-N6)-methyltransferase [Bicyclus anynana]
MSQNIEFYHNQITLARTEIKNLRQRISSLKHEHQKEINNIKSTLNSLRCFNCSAEATSISSTHNNHVNDQASVSHGEVTYKPIGYIETVFNSKRGVPRQPTILTAAQGVVVIDTSVFNNPEHALSGLAEFSHMWIIFHFHMTESSNVPAKVSPPRLEGERRGVFSTRSPHRPCPIGLSLVKLHHIDGNKVYFNGVDMINGTPVLDIKPYIPQYDYPPAYAQPVSVRPPTEGTSDATDALADLQIADESHSRNLSPSSGQPAGTNITSPSSHSPMGDILIPENLLMQISSSPESPVSEDLLDGPVTSPIRRVETERGAPDGQERFTPPQSALNLNQDGIRVASWVTNPPSRTYQVTFTNDANDRLNELIGDRSHSFKANIQGLLSEDPRSVYVRTRYPDHEYSCVLEDLSISCVFDESACLCTIIAVRSAEDLQN